MSASRRKLLPMLKYTHVQIGFPTTKMDNLHVHSGCIPTKFFLVVSVVQHLSEASVSSTCQLRTGFFSYSVRRTGVQSGIRARLCCYWHNARAVQATTATERQLCQRDCHCDRAGWPLLPCRRVSPAISGETRTGELSVVVRRYALLFVATLRQAS